MRKNELSEEIEIIDYRALKILKYFDGKIELEQNWSDMTCKECEAFNKKKKSKTGTLMRIEYTAFVLSSIFQNCSIYQ